MAREAGKGRVRAGSPWDRRSTSGQERSKSGNLGTADFPSLSARKCSRAQIAGLFAVWVWIVPQRLTGAMTSQTSQLWWEDRSAAARALAPRHSISGGIRFGSLSADKASVTQPREASVRPGAGTRWRVGRFRSGALASGAAVVLAACGGSGSATEPTNISTHQVAFRSVLSERLAKPGECAGTGQHRLGQGPVSTCSADGQRFYELGAAELTGSDIATVTARSPAWLAPMAEVDVNFTPSAGLRLQSVTAALVGKPSPTNQFALVLDGLVVGAPQVNAPLDTDSFGVGARTLAAAQKLATMLRPS